MPLCQQRLQSRLSSGHFGGLGFFKNMNLSVVNSGNFSLNYKSGIFCSICHRIFESDNRNSLTRLPVLCKMQVKSLNEILPFHNFLNYCLQHLPISHSFSFIPSYNAYSNIIATLSSISSAKNPPANVIKISAVILYLARDKPDSNKPEKINISLLSGCCQ